MSFSVKTISRPIVRQAISLMESGVGFRTDPTGHLPNRIKMLAGRYEVFLVESICRALPKDGVFADVGANVGYISRQVARRFRAARVLAFEPNPRIYPILEKNLGVYSNCQSFNVGLGAKEGRLEFYHGAESCVGSFMQEYTSTHPGNFHKGQIEKSQVRVAPADAMLSQVTKIDVLKMDVEGYETEVLKGMSQLLAQGAVKTIFFEFCPFAQRFANCEPAEMIHLLSQRGYKVSEIEGESSGSVVNIENLSALLTRLGPNGYTTLRADAR